MDAARPEALLGDDETEPFGPQQVFLRHPAGLEQDFGVGGLAVSRMAHDRNIPDQVETRACPWAR